MHSQCLGQEDKMANNIHKYTVAEGVNLQLGQNGFDIIAESDGAVTGHWVAVYNPNDTHIAIDVTSAIGDSLTALDLCSNGILYGNFTTVECEESSKSLIAYRG
tara:strand:- start:1958 stop:2269 length:312 start_codon:yes stop_codon:yes gene_type:complete